MPKSDMLFPKEPKKKRDRKKEQTDRLKKIYKTVLALDRGKCRVFWVVDSPNFLENKLELCHILPRDVRKPERDEAWNLIFLRKFVHDWIDGRSPNPLGIPHPQFKIYVLEQIKKVHPDQFRWGLALEELKRKE